KGDLLALHFGRLKDKQGRLMPEQVSLCKRNNVRVALDVARRCRALLGGNGILLEYPAIRHMLNLESVFTYERTHEVHTLVLGKDLTVFSAGLAQLALPRSPRRSVRSQGGADLLAAEPRDMIEQVRHVRPAQPGEGLQGRPGLEILGDPEHVG